MDELVKTFHIDWKLMIAQLINFAIVLFVLWKFALKPLMKVMNKRSDEIEKSLENAKEIETRLNEADKLKEEKVLEAKKEAQEIMEKASKEAEQIKNEKIIETKNEVEKLVKKSKEEIGAEKEKMVEDAKKELGNLVILTSGKLIEKNLDDQANRKLVDETIKAAEKD